MKSRRAFLQHSFFGAMAAGSAAFWTRIGEMPGALRKGNFPVVIATWHNEDAAKAAWEILSGGGRALDAVEAGARVPEANPEDSSVGYGGFPDRDGDVTLDACIMDEFGNAGSVTCLQHIKHPVSVARLVMEKTPHVILTAQGALEFALSQGFKKENLLTETARKAWEDWKVKSEYKPVINFERHDTIGIVAIDAQGRASGACTTSGLAFKMKGRVGDSPVIGAGLFVDAEVGAAAATGLGEMVLKTLGSYFIVEEMRRGKHPQKAAEMAIRRLAEKYPEQARENQVGFVALDVKGRHGGFGLQPGFSYTLFQQGKNAAYESGSYFQK